MTNELVPAQAGTSSRVPVMVAAAGDSAAMRFLEFFAGSIRNGNARRASAGAVGEFLATCEGER